MEILKNLKEFPEEIDIPMSDWVDNGMDWIMDNFMAIFDAISMGILKFMLAVESFFLWIPWPVLVLAVALGAWRAMGSRWYGLLMGGMMFMIGCLGQWDLAMMTLSLVTSAVIISLAIGIPLGVAMASSDWFEQTLKPLLDAMQTMPSFVYLIPALMLFGLGKVPALMATIIYAAPPVIRLTNVGIREVPLEMVEAALAFGANRRQVLFKVQFPLARPTIMVGINQTTMMALAMVVVASMIGAKGLGLEVLNAIQRVEVGRGFESGLCIVFMAIIIDRITYAMSTKKE